MTLLFILQGGSQLGSLLFPLVILAIFYFFIMRPQMKKQKEQAAFSQSIQKGEEVVTASGIIGQITKVESHEITLQVDPKTFIRVVPQAISKEMTDQWKAANKTS
jgi:preprotein translocase subunit YajC